MKKASLGHVCSHRCLPKVQLLCSGWPQSGVSQHESVAVAAIPCRFAGEVPELDVAVLFYGTPLDEATTYGASYYSCDVGAARESLRGYVSTLGRKHRRN